MLKNFKQNYKNDIIIGIDEVGRGSLIYDVNVASVIITEDLKNKTYLNDSKKINKTKINKIAEIIKKEAIFYNINKATIKEIEKYNVLKATMLAMERATNEALQFINENEEKLNYNKNKDTIHILIDGNKKPLIKSKNKIIVHCIIKGDAKYTEIAAAAILAKQYRDQKIKEELHPEFEFYRWDTNVGYGTKHHINMIKKHGITKYHRKSFVKKFLIQENNLL